VIHHSHIIEIVILELRLEGSHASAYWQLFFFWKILLSTHVFWPRNLHESDQNLKHLLTHMSILISSAKTWIMMMFHSGQHCFQYLQLEVSYCRVTTVCRTLNACPLRGTASVTMLFLSWIGSIEIQSKNPGWKVSVTWLDGHGPHYLVYQVRMGLVTFSNQSSMFTGHL
jgi:hypothetical protein